MGKWIDNILLQLKAGLLIKTYPYRCCGLTFTDRQEFQNHLYRCHHDDYIIHFAGKFHKTSISKPAKNEALGFDCPPPIKAEKKKRFVRGLTKKEKLNKAQAKIDEERALKKKEAKKVIAAKIEADKSNPTPQKKKKKKRKGGSAWLIYTPMGNKR